MFYYVVYYDWCLILQYILKSYRKYVVELFVKRMKGRSFIYSFLIFIVKGGFVGINFFTFMEFVRVNVDWVILGVSCLDIREDLE